MKLSEKIRIIRKSRNLSQEELGYRLQKKCSGGISRQTISDWENGKCEPVLDNIRNLSEVLDVSFDTLLDDTVDLSDPNILNIALKHLRNDTKQKINNSFRYLIYPYTVTKRDYIKVIIFTVLFALSLAMLIAGICTPIPKGHATNGLTAIGAFSTFTLFCLQSFPIRLIVKIRRGGFSKSIGTLSQTHFVIISWSDRQYDRTIYIPIEQIESMELDNNATRKHGNVIVHVKDIKRQFKTTDIVYPQKLIDVFNNPDTFIDSQNDK